MSARHWILWALTLLSLMLPARAEVSAEGKTADTSHFVMMSDDDPTPWPIWSKVRLHVPAAQALNTAGDANGDGLPEFCINPATIQPEVVWSRATPNGGEVVLSRWTSIAWTTPQSLTSNLDDDRDPRLAFDSNTARLVVWWREGVGGGSVVWLVRELKTQPSEPPASEPPSASESNGAPANNWQPEEKIASEPGARLPHLALFEGTIRVAYQAGVAGALEVRVSAKDASGKWSSEHVATSQAKAVPGLPIPSLDVRVHSDAGHLWIDWVEKPGELAFSSYDPLTTQWGPVETENFSWDASLGQLEWTAREWARRAIRDRVLH